MLRQDTYNLRSMFHIDQHANLPAVQQLQQKSRLVLRYISSQFTLYFGGHNDLTQDVQNKTGRLASSRRRTRTLQTLHR